MDQLALYSVQGALALFAVAITVATYRLSCAYREMHREERRVERMLEKRMERARMKAARRKMQSSRMRGGSGAAGGVAVVHKAQSGSQAVASGRECRRFASDHE